MKKPLTLLIVCLMTNLIAHAQEEAQKNVTVTPYGYVSHQLLFNTYESEDLRDGELYLFPSKPVYDNNGKDVNQRNQLSMLSLQSRFGFKVQGTKIGGAKLTARLEADFFGTAEDYARMLRLRLAVIKLDWEKTEIMLGHAFHPLFVLECMPSNISFAAAAPINPINRSPQIRIKKHLTSNLAASLTFLYHGYHRTPGPRDAQRNAGLPDTQVQFCYRSESLFAGITGGYKVLRPRDITNGGDFTNQSIGTFNIQAFTKVNVSDLTIKLQGIYGENLSHLIMIGGYGAKNPDKLSEEEFDWSSDYEYASIRSFSLWNDIEYKINDNIQTGIFAGYTENLGSSDPFLDIEGYSRFADLTHLWRVSPRMVYSINKLSLALEYSLFCVLYADEYNEFRVPVENLDPVTNNHIIFRTKYVF